MDYALGLALDGWRVGDGPLHRRLAGTIAAAVTAGRLPAGTRLPAERALARDLGIGRGTVSAAYRTLREAGVLDGRQGRGTAVAARHEAPLGARAVDLAGAFQRNAVFGEVVGTVGAPAVDLLAGCAAPGRPVTEAIAAALARVDVAALARDNGYHPLGHPPLRAAVAAHLTALGQPTEAGQVLITGGAQQAVNLAAAGYLAPGQTVLIEDPTFPGALDAYRAAGARLATFPVREDGTDVGLLAAALRVAPVHAVHLTPTSHNPSGTTMPEPARREIARLVRRAGIPVIEDCALAELGFDGPGPPPIGCFADPEAPILGVGSLSKLFWGGLRIGWIRAPRAVIAHLGRLKAVVDLGSPLISQAVAARLLEDADRIRAVRRRELADRAGLLGFLLATRLPGWTWRPPRGGLSIWARLPSGSATRFSIEAAREGVAVAAGPVMSAAGAGDSFIRLPFDHEPAVLRDAVDRLARAWAGSRESGSATGPDPREPSPAG